MLKDYVTKEQYGDWCNWGWHVRYWNYRTINGTWSKVNVYGRNKAKLTYFQNKGAKIFSDARTLAEKSDLIITCVTNFETLKEILFQNNGVMKCSNKELIIADCTTVNSDQSLYCSNLVRAQNGLRS